MNEVSYSKGTTWILLGRSVGYAIALVNSVIVARALGADRLGEYAYAMGLVAFWGLLPNLGISTVVMRTVARDPHATADLVAAAIRLQVLLAGIVTVLIIGFGAILPEQPVPLSYIVLAAVQLALGTLSWPYLAVLGGWARYDRVAQVELWMGIAGLLALSVAAALGGGVAGFLWAHAAAAGLAVFVARWTAAPFLAGQRISRYSMTGLIREGLPFNAAAIVQSFYLRVDVVLLGQMVSSSALGLYSAAYKPINMFVSLGGSAAGTLFPFMVQATGMEGETRLSRLMRLYAVVAPGIALALSGLSHVLLDGLYGPEYVAAAPLLTVLAWSAVAYWLYAPVGVSLQACGKERWWLAALVSGLVLNVAGNIWAIPRWGPIGAATTMLVSEVVLAGMGAVLVKRELHMAPSSLTVLEIIGSASAGCLVLWGLESSGAVPSTLAALGVYGGLLFLCRVVTVEDIVKVAGRFREALPGASCN